MKRAILKISDSYLTALLSMMKSGYHGNYSVIKNALPKDVKIVDVGIIDNFDFANRFCLNLVMESEEFEDLKDGDKYPILEVPEMEFVVVKEAGA